MAAQDGIMSPYTKFGIDISMAQRDIASLPVWCVGAEFDWLLWADGSKFKSTHDTFNELGLKILCVKSRGNQTIWVT